MGIFYFPSDFVYWTKVKNHDSIKKEWIKKIKTCDTSEHVSLKKGKTSYHSEYENFLLQNATFLKDVVWDPIQEMLESENTTLKMKFRSAYVSKAWFSRYDSGASVEYHTHEGHPIYSDAGVFHATLSMIYILHDENNHNQTVFTAPVNSTHQERITHFHTKNISEISEGSLMIFPSSLAHKVDPIEKPGRTIVSFNIDSCFV